MLFIHEMFLVYKLETFKNCKEAKHIMIMTTAIIYFFFYHMWYLMWYLIFILQLKITFWKPPAPPPPPLEKIRSPLKIQKLQAHPFWQKLKSFQDPRQKGGGGGGEDTVALGHLDWNDPYAWYCLSTFFKKKHFF